MKHNITQHPKKSRHINVNMYSSYISNKYKVSWPSMLELRGVAFIDKPQKVEIQKIDSMVVLIWPGDLMLRKYGSQCL